MKRREAARNPRIEEQEEDKPRQGRQTFILFICNILHAVGRPSRACFASSPLPGVARHSVALHPGLLLHQRLRRVKSKKQMALGSSETSFWRVEYSPYLCQIFTHSRNDRKLLILMNDTPSQGLLRNSILRPLPPRPHKSGREARYHLLFCAGGATGAIAWGEAPQRGAQPQD